MNSLPCVIGRCAYLLRVYSKIIPIQAVEALRFARG
jgi:hypothetical protein